MFVICVFTMNDEVSGRSRTALMSSSGGRFVRKASEFRDRVTADGSSGFEAESGRYHLYVSYACPWAHRTLIFRRLKGLEDMISLSVVNAYMGDEGWTFDDGDDVIDGGTGDDRLTGDAGDDEIVGGVIGVQGDPLLHQEQFDVVVV